MNRSFIIISLLATTLGACATSFTGSAHVKDGRAGCEKKCSAEGMQMAGMVFMGEYSDACICEVPEKSSSSRVVPLTHAAFGAGAVGVVLQMRRNDDNDENRFLHIIR
ncbi:MAG: hypothetical protein KIT72_03285 [Polyangiaceae bacterium]|nr:hypothetical protein [Polyangiaceae bacterium]MCW5789424.1 hypothetical protein [Polyangiaceae bacterium]